MKRAIRRLNGPRLGVCSEDHYAAVRRLMRDIIVAGMNREPAVQPGGVYNATETHPAIAANERDL